MKNSAGRGRCYPQRLKAEVDNTLRDLQNSSYPTKAEFSNCFIWLPGFASPYGYSRQLVLQFYFQKFCLIVRLFVVLSKYV